MTQLLSVPLDAGGSEIVVFEVDRTEIPDDLVLASPEPDELAERAKVTLEDGLAKLKPSLRKIAHTLKDLSPESTEIEFGLKIGGETGIIIAKGTAEVNFTIRMSWKSD
jgi:hypothetical protein